MDALWRKGEELGLTGYDKIATATAFTAESIRLAVEHHCRAFKYDPLKRVPPRPAALETERLKEEDFSL